MSIDEGDARLLRAVTERIIGGAFGVANAPGCGLVETVYENGPAHEVLIVEDQIIVDLTVVGDLSDVHVPQSRDDLRAAGKSLCLLINFGRPKVEVRRITAEA
jgi:hypothetical protein